MLILYLIVISYLLRKWLTTDIVKEKDLCENLSLLKFLLTQDTKNFCVTSTPKSFGTKVPVAGHVLYKICLVASSFTV